MIRLQQIKCPLSHTEEDLKEKICEKLKTAPDTLISLRIVKRSLDARKKPELYYIYTVDCQFTNEKRLKKKADGKNILIPVKNPYRFVEPGQEKLIHRPVIVGSGPAGLFCAYMLAKHGYAPLVIERGESARERQKAVEEFWKTGLLNPKTNVQFGEGGAGTFSDGKLNTSVKDPHGRNRLVLETFVRFGAPEQILYDQKPHIGTDLLIRVITAMREEITRMGGRFLFSHQLTDIEVEDGRIRAIKINHTTRMETEVLVMAIGHSARDTFFTLYERGLQMEAKAFALGVRIEHPQAMINMSQYGAAFIDGLGAASYKLTHTTKENRGIYSFCMCPGGYVVNASSEERRLAINGMSYQKRDGQNANSAMVVTVNPADYRAYAKADTPDALKGIAFQRVLEERAFALCEGKIPVQLFGDFLAGRPSMGPGEVLPATKGAYAYGNVRKILPDFVASSIEEGIQAFGRKIKGFDREDCLLDGIESRTSSPVRMPRNEDFESNIAGLYPCGEGAGYAGGITSAAIDGIRIAEAVSKKYGKLS